MTKPKHTSLSLMGNVPKREYSNKERSKFYDKEDIYNTTSQIGKGHYYKKNQGQVGTGFWSSVIGGVSGAIGGIVGSVAGPIGAGALGAAASYEGKKIAEQYGLGYQYKSPKNVGLWGTTPNALGPVSMNMPIKL